MSLALVEKSHRFTVEARAIGTDRIGYSSVQALALQYLYSLSSWKMYGMLLGSYSSVSAQSESAPTPGLSLGLTMEELTPPTPPTGVYPGMPSSRVLMVVLGVSMVISRLEVRFPHRSYACTI